MIEKVDGSRETTTVNRNERAFIQRASFSYAEADRIECDKDLTLESIHIAFMQREALRFEAKFIDLAADESAFSDEKV